MNLFLIFTVISCPYGILRLNWTQDFCMIVKLTDKPFKKKK
ncbi:hypothetical protein MY7_3843 [Bacillus sp. 5B6]|nr:hypothetical protein MY7_3843 [Bacillus sp. 5B6]